MAGADPDRRLARLALRELGLNARLRRVATGLDSTYRAELDDGTRLAVRIGGRIPIRRPAALVTEAAWIRALHDDGAVSVPAVLAPAGDEPFVVVDADGVDRGCLVLSWLAGRKMRWRFAAHHAHALGAAAADLHRHALSFDPPSAGWAKDWGPAAVYGASHSRGAIADVAGPGAADTIAAIEAAVTDAFKQLGGQDQSLVNGDLGPHNVVWDQRRPGLFDFNDLGEGYQAWDLARYLHGLRWRPTGEALVHAALDGYQQIRPLPAGFIDYGPLLEVAAGLFLAHYLAGRIAERGEQAARRVRELTHTAEQYLQASQPKLPYTGARATARGRVAP